MTSEERQRMNRLCLGIQEETDYTKFTAMLHEMSELIARKEQRRFQQYPKLVWGRNKPWKSVPAVVNKIVPPVLAEEPEKVEISVAEADDLFREIRIANRFSDIDGGQVALKSGARLDVTFEVEPQDHPA